MSNEMPGYLADYRCLYDVNPREAAIAWFREARFGLFLHYGLYALLGGEYRGRPITHKGSEWIRLTAPIPYKEYEALKERFSAERFDADFITDLALEAGMRYVNLTAQHHDGFCLWNTATTDFNSVQCAAGRDLVGELVAACDRKGLGCFLYYSHGRDWWHPHSPDNGEPACRPSCPEDKDRFASGDEYDLNKYLDFVEKQVDELCAYSPVAGIWLDGIGGFKGMENGVEASRARELYDRIHATAPHLLVSYKQGLTGTEDFLSPERKVHDPELPETRPYEICTTLQERSWGYKKANDGNHRDADWVMKQLDLARSIAANLLLNTGPEGDGAIPEEDVRTLRETGRRLRETGKALDSGTPVV